MRYFLGIALEKTALLIILVLYIYMETYEEHCLIRMSIDGKRRNSSENWRNCSGKGKKKEIKLMKQANIKNKNSSGRILFSITLILLVYFFFMNSKDIIINYPQNIFYGTFFGLFFISSVFVVRKIIKSNSIRKQKDLLDKFIFWVMSFLKIAIISWFVAGILLIPLNYSIINYSKSQMSFIELVEIEQLWAHAGKDQIFFKLNGRMNSINVHKPIMNDIYTKKNHYNYLLELEIKESLLGSYVLINWDIIEKK